MVKKQAPAKQTSKSVTRETKTSKESKQQQVPLIQRQSSRKSGGKTDVEMKEETSPVTKILKRSSSASSIPKNAKNQKEKEQMVKPQSIVFKEEVKKAVKPKRVIDDEDEI